MTYTNLKLDSFLLKIDIQMLKGIQIKTPKHRASQIKKYALDQ